MSPSMARQGGQVQLEQSNRRLALNMAKIAKGGCSHTAMKEMRQLRTKPLAEVREDQKLVVEFPGHRKVKAAMNRHPTMVCENWTDGCLPSRNGTGKNPQTHMSGTGTRAHPPDLATPSPRTPPALAGGKEGAQSSEIEGVPPGYVYIHNPLPYIQFFNLDAYAKDRKHDDVFIPDLLTNEGTSTG